MILFGVQNVRILQFYVQRMIIFNYLSEVFFLNNQAMTNCKNGQQVSIIKKAPTKGLVPFIDKVWHLKDRKALLSGKVERGIPEGNIELVFELATPSAQSRDHISFENRPRAFICGMLPEAYYIKATGPSEVIGFTFKAARLQNFVDFPISDLAAKIVKLEDIYGLRVKSLIDQLMETSDDDLKINLIENFLIRSYRESYQLNAFIYRAVGMIEASHGQRSMRDISQKLRVSSRHLRRQFKEMVGLSPKTFAKLIRIKSIIAAQ